jgi:hypothetical protein
VSVPTSLTIQMPSQEHGGDLCPPSVDILQLGGKGARFCILRIGQWISIHMPGYEEESREYMRQLRDALDGAIARMEAEKTTV